WDGSFVFTGTPTFKDTAGEGGSGWDVNAESLRHKNGKHYRFTCPAHGDLGYSVTGTDMYTDDSAVCVAAVHAGLITVAAGGVVTIEIKPGAASYRGSTRNGVTSDDYDAWDGSFVFVTGG